MTLDANRVDHVRNFDFSKIPSGWSFLAGRMVRYAALHADSRGVLNINRKTFFAESVGEKSAQYEANLINAINRKVDGVTFSTLGRGSSARLVIVFDDEKISKSLEKKEG